MKTNVLLTKLTRFKQRNIYTLFVKRYKIK